MSSRRRGEVTPKPSVVSTVLGALDAGVVIGRVVRKKRPCGVRFDRRGARPGCRARACLFQTSLRPGHVKGGKEAKREKERIDSGVFLPKLKRGGRAAIRKRRGCNGGLSERGRTQE